MPAIAPSSASAASAGVSPAASALAAPASAPNGSAGPGDFNSQFDAAIQPDAAPTPAPAAPPAATPPPAKSSDDDASADGKGSDDAGDNAPAPADPAAGISNAVLESMAALLGSVTPLPPPPAPAPPPVAGADSSVAAAPAFPAGEGDPASAPSPDAPAPLATPGAGTGAGAGPAQAAATALGAAAALPASTVALPLAQSQASENNAAPDSAKGINVLSSPPVTSQAVASPDDKSGQKRQKDGSDDTDDKKSSPNDLLAGAFPTDTTVSGQLGTLFSETGVMPPVMEKNAALPEPAPTADAGSLGAALAAISPAKVGSTLSVASFLRGYPIASNAERGHGAGDSAAASPSGSAPAAPASSALSSNASGNESDKSVTLTSNTQFVDVIRQALDDRPMTTPTRIAVELQTPPGAMVTVFFSQANGQLRAQLSANDSGSLHWLQQQVSTLRDGGGNAGSVVWLPPQLDKQPGEGDSSARQQQQQQPQKQNAPSAEDMALAESIFGGTQTGMEAVRN